ncbi:MAG: prolyl oligopeptidase family serine peptidase [Steroidobacteraceae bacterium]
MSTWTLVSAVLAAPVIGFCANQRPYTVAIMTQVQQIGTARFGPQGRRLLMQQVAAYDESRNFGWFPWGRYRSTLLGVDIPGQEEASAAHTRVSVAATRIAGAPRAGVWLRAFSPEGDEAAIGWLDGDVPRAGVYDFKTGRLRKFRYRIATVYCSLNCPFWLSDSKYIDYTLPLGAQEEEMSRIEYDDRLVDRADRQTWAGRKAAAKVYCSGGACKNRGGEEASGKWIWVDARTGQRRVLGSGMWEDLALSPDRRRVAVVYSAGTLNVGGLATISVWIANSVQRLAVYDLRSGAARLLPCPSCNVTPGSLRWSPDGEKLFFDTRRNNRGGKERHRQFIYDFTKGRLESFAPQGLRFRVAVHLETATYLVPFAWLNNDTAVIRVDRIIKGTGPVDSRSSPRARRPQVQYDWYAVPQGHRPLNLTAGLGGARPEALSDFVAVHRGALLIMAAGNLWKLSPDGHRRNLTQGFSERLIPWCSVHADWRSAGLAPVCSGLRAESLAIFSAHRPVDPQALARGWLTFRILKHGVATAALLFLNVDTGQAVRLAAPGPHAQLIAASALAKAALYNIEGQAGDEAVLVQLGQSAVDLWHFNRQLNGVVGTTPIMLPHREPGELSDRIDWLLLPPDYRPGEREPLLVYFYPDNEYTASWDAEHLLREVSMLNMQIPAAHGYAVLLASMRMPPSGKPENPCSDMQRQLIDAANNAVMKGYADRTRWVLMGHSYGGYGVYCVVAHTHRFKTAIALDGPANLTSAYGEGGFPDAAGTGADLAVATLWAEGNQGRMGAPPWVDPQRYIHNSPLFLVNRIATPLLIFQGNDDQIVSVAEPEQMFNALHRLGKTAEFVRYWGEGHVYQSPANINDMWQRIFAWIDRYLDIRRDPRGRVVFVGHRVQPSRPPS